ncbi:MAG: hypothetical protein OXJ56_14665, partial [Rhodospirillaceae bacterium]|nr:hypothetical protein [Rhodospirillaceae bacterium]
AISKEASLSFERRIRRWECAVGKCDQIQQMTLPVSNFVDRTHTSPRSPIALNFIGVDPTFKKVVQQWRWIAWILAVNAMF